MKISKLIFTILVSVIVLPLEVCPHLTSEGSMERTPAEKITNPINYTKILEEGITPLIDCMK